MHNDRIARAIDRWWTTDPAIEAECVECGHDSGHDDDCPNADWEPDYEQMHHDRQGRHGLD